MVIYRVIISESRISNLLAQSRGGNCFITGWESIAEPGRGLSKGVGNRYLKPRFWMGFSGPEGAPLAPPTLLNAFTKCFRHISALNRNFWFLALDSACGFEGGIALQTIDASVAASASEIPNGPHPAWRGTCSAESTATLTPKLYLDPPDSTTPCRCRLPASHLHCSPCHDRSAGLRRVPIILEYSALAVGTLNSSPLGCSW